MSSISYKDERIKLVLFILVVFMIQGMLFYCFTQKILTVISEEYIVQNTAIIGEIAKHDGTLVKEIIPIMTGKADGDMMRGEAILKEYSYGVSLAYEYNPLFKSILSINSFALITQLVILCITLVGSQLVIKPVFNELKFLSVRAQQIVENRPQHTLTWHGYRGSLEKFIDQFILMEDRIKNSIELLQGEKVHLKNIINDISHQLKTPLMALSMYNDILHDYEQMEASEINEFITLSKEQLNRMDWLVKTLLKYARLESNVVEYHKAYVSLNNTIEQSVDLLAVKAREKNQSLTFEATKEIYYLHDERWVAEAISNIVKNAIEHTPKEGNIEVALNETPLSIVISIKDNGEGIEKKELKKIFKRFHKGENALNSTSIGIGLCLSKMIIQAHDGSITVESEPGVGSTFYITFLKTINSN